MIRKQLFSFSTKKCLYQTLKLDKNASQEEIKKSFTELAKIYHPDLNKKNEQLFIEILSAYKILNNKKDRDQYDQQFQQKSQQFKYNYEQKQQQENKEDLSYKNQFKNRFKKEKNSGDLLEEGLFKNMNEAPELYIISLVMVMIIIKFSYTISQQQEKINKLRYQQDDHEFSAYYIGVQKFNKFQQLDDKGIKKYKKRLSDQDCLGKTVQELDILEKVYILPGEYLEQVHDYRDLIGQNQTIKISTKPSNNEDFSKFNYRKNN